MMPTFANIFLLIMLACQTVQDVHLGTNLNVIGFGDANDGKNYLDGDGERDADIDVAINVQEIPEELTPLRKLCGVPTGQQYWPHPTNCRMYVQCTDYGPQELSCTPGTAWSQPLRTCNHEANTDCGQDQSLDNGNDTTWKCGITNAQRIFGGMEVTPNRKYPYHVGLYIPGKDIFECGGSIINDRWILTAAHCIAQKKMTIAYGLGPLAVVYYCQIKYNSSYPLKVLVGDSMYGDNAINYTIKKYVPHPKYDCIDFDYDFALLELTDSILFNNFTRPVCLPKDNTNTYVGKFGTVTGWGHTSYNISYSTIVKELKLIILDSNKCGNWPNLPGVKMCAGTKRGKAACFGDSGGPFVIVEDEKYVQVGIVSFGKEECDNPDYPLILSRVSREISWITNIVN